MKILFLSDSLGYPRKTEPIKINDLYSSKFLDLLKLSSENITMDKSTNHKYKTGDVFIHQVVSNQISITSIAIGGLFSDALLPIIMSVRPEQFDLVVFQMGIVDCTPRVFSWKQRMIISQIPPLRYVLPRIARKHRKSILYFYRRFLNKVLTYTSEERFKETLEYMKNRCEKRLFIINICPNRKVNYHRSPDWMRQIIKYNVLIREVAGNHIIDVFDKMSKQPEKYILYDGHHLNRRGHELVAELIYNRVQRWI